MKTSELFNISGKWALVTGGATGIGFSIANFLAQAGAKIILVSRNEKALIQSSNHLNESGFFSKYFVADLTKENEIKNCIQFAILNDPVDILVNAAGINLREPFSEVTYASWREQIDIHLGAPFFLTQGLAPGMRKKSWGRIINIASLQSYRAFPNSAPYGAGKGGIPQLTRAIAREWSRFGINCNAIGPGFFPTALTKSVFENSELSKKNAEQTCIGRNGTLEDLQGITLFLSSNASSYITGQTIMVDGGFSAK